MARLFTYCIPYDDGAAPNPFWGICTLVICKPDIRRVAGRDDWIVGTGSVNAPGGDASGRVVYAMRVTETMSMQEYDEHCRAKLPDKIPDWTSADPRRKSGDCIYDFSTSPPTLRAGVHSQGNAETDLAGVNALLSTDFYYFGKNAVPLPKELLPIVNQGQKHRSTLNDPFRDEFVRWIRKQKAGLNGEPQRWGDASVETCGECRARDNAEDLRGGCDESR